MNKLKFDNDRLAAENIKLKNELDGIHKFHPSVEPGAVAAGTETGTTGAGPGRTDIIKAPPAVQPVDSQPASNSLIFIVAETILSIASYVVIEKREKLIPLILSAIQHHPSTKVRDLLTNTLFNLIKKTQ